MFKILNGIMQRGLLECNNMDPSGSVLVRPGRSVHRSGKLQHHQPLSRVADMTSVNGRIEMRPGRERAHRAYTSSRRWNERSGERALLAVENDPPGTILSFYSLGSGQRSRCPRLIWGRTASAPRYVDFRWPGSTVVMHSTLDHCSGVTLLYSYGE